MPHSGASLQRAFETTHPLVLMAYVVVVAATTMCAFQPVFVCISLLGALVCSVLLCGLADTLDALRWQLPLFVLVGIANPLLSQRGSTVIWQAGIISVRLESLVFGLCMGAMLLASLTWFWLAGKVLSLDRLLGMGGGLLPTVGLMLSMVVRLVPQLVRRGRRVNAVRAACSAVPPGSSPVRDGARLSGILLSWSLEDSLERSDAMRARGWSSGGRRSSYLLRQFLGRDALALFLVLALGLVDAFLEWVACSQWQFYPTMPHVVVWWGYAPHVVLVLLPAMVMIVERLRWARVEGLSCKK